MGLDLCSSATTLTLTVRTARMGSFVLRSFTRFVVGIADKKTAQQLVVVTSHNSSPHATRCGCCRSFAHVWCEINARRYQAQLQGRGTDGAGIEVAGSRSLDSKLNVS